MQRYPALLRCYARPERDHFVAFCLDLCLADRGETLEGAIRALEENITLHLESLTPENISYLFPRSSPWWSYLDYYLVCLVVWFSKLSHYLRHHFRVFVEPLQISPRLSHGSI